LGEFCDFSYFFAVVCKGSQSPFLLTEFEFRFVEGWELLFAAAVIVVVVVVVVLIISRY
jgi:ABC-type glycerol-3-phosphate transport system permease component